MLKGFKNISKSKSSAGLEVIVLPDASYELNLIILKQQKSTLITEKQLEGLVSFEEAAIMIDTRLPINLVINGKGIIHRKVNINENDTSATLLNKVLPNANLNEFTVQKTPINSTHAFVSVIRTNILTEIIDELIKNKLTAISSCFLGPFLINDLLPLINSSLINNELLNFSNYQLQIREQVITEITTLESANDNKQLLIGEEHISQKLVIPFAAALAYFTLNNNSISNSDIINNLKEEFLQKQKLEFRTKVLLAATFIILLLNYFIFDNYWAKKNEMNSKLSLTQSALEHYNTLNVEFKQKKEFLMQNGLLENSRTSFYADQLAENLPATIQWTSLNVHPLKKKKASDESDVLFFENKMITVSGNCQKSTELNEWMKSVKKNNWVSDITMVNYKQDNAKEDGEFLIEVRLK